MTSINELKNKTAQLPPVDPNVAMPAAIRAQAARSAALHQEAYSSGEPAQQEPKKDGSEGEPQTPKSQEPAPAKTGKEDTPPAPASEPPQQPDNKDRNWENDYHAMKGRYDKLNGETLPALNSRIAQLEALLAQPRQQEQPRPPSEMTFGKLSDKDREDFGEDFLDAAARAAEERLGKHIQSLEQQVRQLGGTVTTAANASKVTAQQMMYSTLNEQLPNWRDVNRDQGFIAWTNQTDPLSGQPRIKLLREAFDKNDGPRVLMFFKSFLSDEAVTAPALAPQTETPKNTGKVPLETFAAPGRAKAPAASTPPGEKETISQAQIAQFYLDVQKGKYKGNEAEKNRLEQMIFEAQAEGRIT